MTFFRFFFILWNFFLFSFEKTIKPRLVSLNYRSCDSFISSRRQNCIISDSSHCGNIKLTQQVQVYTVPSSFILMYAHTAVSEIQGHIPVTLITVYTVATKFARLILRLFCLVYIVRLKFLLGNIFTCVYFRCSSVIKVFRNVLTNSFATKCWFLNWHLHYQIIFV